MTLISRRSALGRALRDGLTDLYLVGPATLVLAVLIFVPVLVVFALSFTDYQLGSRSVTWVGFDQYVTLFTDPIGRRAIVNTLIYVAVMVPASIVLAASASDRSPIPATRPFCNPTSARYRSVLPVPSITSPP